jgi:hypothetical protein
MCPPRGGTSWRRRAPPVVEPSIRSGVYTLDKRRLALLSEGLAWFEG